MTPVPADAVRFDAGRLPPGGGGASPLDALSVPSAVAHGAVRELLALRPVLTACGLGLGLAGTADPAARPAGPAEEAAASAMPDGRRREFLAGRLAARRALCAVGLDCGDIPRAGRAPVFPPGRTASITHSDGLAVAVARVPGRLGPAGCDLELRPLPGAAARLVLREDEERWLREAGPAEHLGDRLTALFSAKEAAWKALHAPTAHAGPAAPVNHAVPAARTGPTACAVSTVPAACAACAAAREASAVRGGAGRGGPGPAVPEPHGLDGFAPHCARPVPAVPAHSSGTLRDLRAEPLGDRVRVWSRTAPERAVDVRVVPLVDGVFSWVLGRAAGPADERP
ncbi:4'-phosphopantetheinyl transferase superfamily protein [Streptomyces sp. TG1A-8]|uniref:4'-phosphopantetheinyl transferase superfamily protein n=1 Tax=Streptomyces sp. TG1A-8 TaxID=3051385 RepID=UPI00265B8F10|nr:4'-phosphopantetheinyl transferase superfamily protein [Streptomyces sp. TG1A-8]MDO0924342.1 4'-phosphopantetheinyl transferase superfamily protein [Streptomyces sp. TG1A-8]